MPRRSSARSHSITSQESYAAVMIADVVADVPVESVTEEEDEPPTKEVTNFAYDGHLDGEVTSPGSNDSPQKANGSSISRGVILNAVQYGQNDAMSKGEEKSIPMSTSMQVPEIKQPVQEPKGFKDMSLLRKVAFGFSFLPSIFFILCFAIILPCKPPKPCIEEKWTVRLNDTGFTSRLEAPENIVFTALKRNKNVYIQLDRENGNLKEVEIFDNPAFLTCGKITSKERRDCIVMDQTGKFHLFNNSLDQISKNINLKEDKKATNPVIVSGCNEELESVAIAVKNDEIMLLYDQNRISPYKFSHCDSVPIKLTAWVINGSSNIIFICDKDGKDRLISVPKNAWCASAGLPKEEPIVLKSGDVESLKKSIIIPINDGILLWSGSEAFMLQPNASVLWSASNLSHTDENRFVLYGNFIGDDDQLAFISSSLLSGLQVTLLDPVNGNLVKQFSHPKVEATEVIEVEGKNKDFALLLLKKTAQYSVTRALNQIKDISTTIVNLVSNEEAAPVTQGPISEELALLDFDGNIDTIKFLQDIKDGAHKSTMTAIHDGKSGVLSIYYISTSEFSLNKFSEVRNIDVANWDKSTKSKCKL